MVMYDQLWSSTIMYGEVMYGHWSCMTMYYVWSWSFVTMYDVLLSMLLYSHI